MKYHLSLIGFLLGFLLTIPAHAALFRQGDNVGVTIPVHDNLYAAGGVVTVQSPIEGDLVVAGGTVRIEGVVGNTLQAAGGQISLAAPVRKSARLAGGTVSVTQSVGGDLIVFGGQISVESGAVVTGDMVVFGGSVMMSGTVKGSLRAFGGDVVLGGRVDGPVEMNAESVTVNGTVGGEAVIAANSLAIGSNAAFGKNVRYWTASGQVDFGPALKAGRGTAAFDATLKRTTQSQAYETAKRTSAGIATLFGVYSLLSSALLMIVFLLLGRKAFARAGDRLRQAPWWSLLIGFLYVVATPVLIILLFATIVGLPIAFFILAFYIFSWMFGTVVTALLLARWIETKKRQHWSLGMFFLVCLGVLLGLKILFFLPILGWIIHAVLLFMAFGALLSTALTWWQRGAAAHA